MRSRRGRREPTLSSMVSNLVRRMPSMVRGLPSSEWSSRAWLKLASWATASLPTRASPTNRTKSGEFTRISCQGEEGRGGRGGGGERGERGGEGGEGGMWMWRCRGVGWVRLGVWVGG